MHPYGIDSAERRIAIVLMILVSYALTTWLGRFDWLIAALPLNLVDWFDPFSAATLFVVFSWAFERWGWKVARVFRLTRVPNLNGTWSGDLASSFDCFSTKLHVELDIKQTWSQIVVEMRSPGRSGSRSATASIYLNAGVNPELVYTYRNDPNPDQPASMVSHPGTAQLRVLTGEGTRRLEGTYYTGQGRTTYGDMKLKRS